jgi:hypothetical protein
MAPESISSLIFSHPGVSLTSLTSPLVILASLYAVGLGANLAVRLHVYGRLEEMTSIVFPVAPSSNDLDTSPLDPCSSNPLIQKRISPRDPSRSW